MFHLGADANYTIKSDCYICNSNKGAGQKSQLAHTYTVSVIRNEFLVFFSWCFECLRTVRQCYLCEEKIKIFFRD